MLKRPITHGDRCLELPYERSIQKDRFWGSVLNAWHIARWCDPNWTLRQFATHCGLCPSTVHRRFNQGKIRLESGELFGPWGPSVSICKTLERCAKKNDWHVARIVWLYEQSRLQISKQQFSDKYALSHNTTRQYLNEMRLREVQRPGLFHKAMIKDSKQGWIRPIAEVAQKPEQMRKLLAQFYDNWPELALTLAY